MLKLPVVPLDESGLQETLAAAKKKLSLLVHPDKAPTDTWKMNRGRVEMAQSFVINPILRMNGREL